MLSGNGINTVRIVAMDRLKIALEIDLVEQTSLRAKMPARGAREAIQKLNDVLGGTHDLTDVGKQPETFLLEFPIGDVDVNAKNARRVAISVTRDPGRRLYPDLIAVRTAESEFVSIGFGFRCDGSLQMFPCSLAVVRMHV